MMLLTTSSADFGIPGLARNIDKHFTCYVNRVHKDVSKSRDV